MERLDAKSLGMLLGIDSPWMIKSFAVDQNRHLVDIHLALTERKSLFGFRDGSKTESENTVEGSWSYIPLGNFQTVVHAAVPSSLAQGDSPLSRMLIAQLAFLGNPKVPYSNYVRQKVALAQLKGGDLAQVAEHLRISSEQLNFVLDDLGKTSAQLRSLASLPTELDDAWLQILDEQLTLNSNVLPLKFLLSKLRRNELPKREQVLELRKFFIENASILEKELDQVCGIKTRQQIQHAKGVKSKLRLVLPPLKNPVWLDLLSGKIKLNSTSVPLNLLISRQRAAFIEGKSKIEKVQAIDTLRTYFKKNYRTLKREFLLLNKAMQQKQRTAITLPNPEHVIWQKILHNHDFLPSENMAYKLLLSKLKAQIALHSDPVVKLEAATKVRDFLRQNQKTMQKELSVLVKHAAAQ